MPKKVVEKSSFTELKIERVKFFNQNPIKFFCINVFKAGRCLANCLTLRLTLTLDP